MKVLETNKDFELAMYEILAEKPKFLYIATYGINLSNEFAKKFFKNVPKNTTLIVGIRPNDSPWISDYIGKWFHGTNITVHVYYEFHTKMVVSDKYAIVGGRNLTNSGWEDRSFLLTSKSSVKQCKSSFEKFLKK